MVAISPQIAIIAMLLHHLAQLRERERRRVRKHSIARIRKEQAQVRIEKLNRIPNREVNQLLLRQMPDA